MSDIEYQYLGFGTSEIQNAFRGVNIILPVADNPGVYRLTLSKRGQRAGAKSPDGDFVTSIYLKHSFPQIYWVQVDEPEEKKKGNAAKYTVENVLGALSVAHGWKTTDLQKHLKDESGMASSTFYSLWNEIKNSGKVRCDDDGKWYKKGLKS